MSAAQGARRSLQLDRRPRAAAIGVRLVVLRAFASAGAGRREFTPNAQSGSWLGAYPPQTSQVKSSFAMIVFDPEHGSVIPSRRSDVLVGPALHLLKWHLLRRSSRDFVGEFGCVAVTTSRGPAWPMRQFASDLGGFSGSPGGVAYPCRSGPAAHRHIRAAVHREEGARGSRAPHRASECRRTWPFRCDPAGQLRIDELHQVRALGTAPDLAERCRIDRRLRLDEPLERVSRRDHSNAACAGAGG